jgi:hypothetical protein
MTTAAEGLRQRLREIAARGVSLKAAEAVAEDDVRHAEQRLRTIRQQIIENDTDLHTEREAVDVRERFFDAVEATLKPKDKTA